MQLPTIQENNDLQQAVDAKELYQSLGLNTAHWAKWHARNIDENPFATRGLDYQTFTQWVRGNETRNYLLSIEFAKKLAMQVRTEMGERIRNYFLDCERKASQPVVALPDFTNPAIAARAWADEYQEKQIAQEQLAIAAPKAAALDTLSHAKGSLGVRETAKAVGIPEREFVRRCLDKSKPLSSRFLYRDDKGRLNAHAHRIKQGFMTQKVASYEGKDGYDVATIQVKFTAAGVAHIAKLMQNKPVNHLRVLEAV
ncbi:phage antirepressor KilAC domain-containing protein [Psychrobacter sp. ER1]|uniref:phage antirepressor KilAC domain-containing protein n=1 Tax=Psychrobacter sp. ER1 TaxID=3406645 RepID=UPI003B435563